MKLQQIHQQNNELQKQLTSSNKSYYEEMLTYIHSNSRLDEQHTEEILLQLLQDLLQAQKNSQSAEEFFGKDPKAVCDQYLAKLPNKKTLTSFLTIIFITFLQYELFSNLLEPIVTISFFKTILPILLFIVAFVFLLLTLNLSSATENKQKRTLFPLLTVFFWAGAVMTPLIGKSNGSHLFIVSHQLFALLLLVFSVILLIFQVKIHSGYSLLVATTVFIVFELSVIFSIIYPASFSNAGKTIFSLLLLLIILAGPFLEQHFRKVGR